MPSLAGVVAFSLTWAQLAALRDMPRELPKRGFPYASDAALIDKGLVRLNELNEMLHLTTEGAAMLSALDGLVPPKGHS
jgi:hypothetical protein